MKDHSPADGRHRMLAEGQELLLARRKALHLARERSTEAPLFGDPAPSPYPSEQYSVSSSQYSVSKEQPTANSRQLAAMIAELPEHLGWGSTTQTAVLRAAEKRHCQKQQNKTETPVHQPKEMGVAQAPPRSPGTKKAFYSDGVVSLAPALGLAILRHKKAPAARLWLLLRAVDGDGCGAISLAKAKKAFTNQDSPLRFCGRRQLRNLLASGSGIFWEVNKQMIWLRSPARVAQVMTISHFRGADVAMPVSALIGGIATVRANLFTAFHSGRAAKPISRQTLAGRSGVAPRTQRRYDRLSGVERQANYARGPKIGSKEAEEQAWQQGPASFTWRDTRNGQKESNGRFLAWQLPNSYYGPHTRLGRGRQKRQNKALADLLNKGTAGNGQGQLDDLHPRFTNLGVRYFADARAATRACSRSDSVIYWPDLKPGLWHCLWPQKMENNKFMAKRRTHA